MHSAFYLHGGPGLSATPEREWLGEFLGVYWWDQPYPMPSALHPFTELVDAAETEFYRLAVAAGGKIGLLANSFGANLALFLAYRIPRHISSIVLLNPVHDMRTAFLRLAKRLAASNLSQCGELLATAERLATRIDDREKFWQLVGAIFSYPDFLDMYWSPHAEHQRQWLKRLMVANPAVFDFEAFQAITNDFLNNPMAIGAVEYRGPVSILLGSHDPLADTRTDGLFWQQYFPQAEIQVVDAGHFSHLELPPERWLPR